MARTVEVEVEIAPDGTVQVHVKGKKGRGCLEIQQIVEAALGPSIEERRTAEYYEVEEKVSQTIKTKR